MLLFCVGLFACPNAVSAASTELENRTTITFPREGFSNISNVIESNYSSPNDVKVSSQNSIGLSDGLYDSSFVTSSQAYNLAEQDFAITLRISARTEALIGVETGNDFGMAFIFHNDPNYSPQLLSDRGALGIYGRAVDNDSPDVLSIMNAWAVEIDQRAYRDGRYYPFDATSTRFGSDSVSHIAFTRPDNGNATTSTYIEHKEIQDLPLPYAKYSLNTRDPRNHTLRVTWELVDAGETNEKNDNTYLMSYFYYLEGDASRTVTRTASKRFTYSEMLSSFGSEELYFGISGSSSSISSYQEVSFPELYPYTVRYYLEGTTDPVPGISPNPRIGYSAAGEIDAGPLPEADPFYEPIVGQETKGINYSGASKTFIFYYRYIPDILPPVISPIYNQTIMDGDPIEDIKLHYMDDRSLTPMVTVTGLPQGVTYDTVSDTISGVPTGINWADQDAVAYPVTVTVTDDETPANSVTETFTITVLRDTDGDGIPDIDDLDDDGDCIPDEKDNQPKAADTTGVAEWQITALPTIRYTEGDIADLSGLILQVTEKSGAIYELTYQQLVADSRFLITSAHGSAVTAGTHLVTISAVTSACVTDLNFYYYGYPEGNLPTTIEYTTDDEGTYPSTYAQDDTHVRYPEPSVLEYKEAKLSKTATETNTPGKFTIDLRIEGESDPYKEKTDVVIVLDNSNSMAGRVVEVSSDIQMLVEDLLDTDKNAEGNLRMALVTYGSVVFNGDEKVVVDTTDKLSYSGSAPDHTSDAFTTVAQDIVKLLPQSVPEDNTTIENYRFLGGTFTQAGLEYAAKLLETSTATNQLIVTITDGVPTRSYVVESVQAGTEGFQIVNYMGIDGFDTSMIATAYDPVIHLHQTTSLKGSGESYWLLDRIVYNNFKKYITDYVVQQTLVSDNGFATMSYARDLQRQGIQMASMGIALEDTPSYHGIFNPVPKAIAVNNVMNLASDESMYWDVPNPADVDTYLRELFNYQFRQVRDGEVIDPMGERIALSLGTDGFDASDFVLTASDGSELRGGIIYKGDTPLQIGQQSLLRGVTVTESNGTLFIDGLNLGEGMWVNLSYDVHLLTEMTDFQEDFYYQTNGRTTLAPDIDNPTKLLDFPIPSVSGDMVDLVIQKLWRDADGNKLPEDRRVPVTVRVNQTNLGTLQRTLLQTIVLDPQEGWEKTLTDLPAYDNLGNLYRYTIEETGNAAFQTQTVYYDPDGQVLSVQSLDGRDGRVEITNTWREAHALFRKVDGSAVPQAPLAGAEFELLDASQQRIRTATSTFSGMLDFGILGIGQYYLREIMAPEGGYLLDNSLRSLVVRHDGTLEYSGSTENRLIRNSKETLAKVAIQKVTANTTGGVDAISGASFQIVKTDGVLPYDSSSGAYVPYLDPNSNETLRFGIFGDLTAGTYEIRESRAPSGFQKVEDIYVLEVETEIDDFGNRTNVIVYIIRYENESALERDEGTSIYEIGWGDNQLPEDIIFTDPVGFRVMNEPLDLLFQKQNEEGDPQEGATFQLFRESPNGIPYLRANGDTVSLLGVRDDEGDVLEATSATEGKFTFSKITPGIYYLMELSAPDGYAKYENPIGPFELKEDGSVTETTELLDLIPYANGIAVPIINLPSIDITLTKVWEGERPQNPTDLYFVLERKSLTFLEDETVSFERVASSSQMLRSDAPDQTLVWNDLSPRFFYRIVELTELDGYHSLPYTLISEDMTTGDKDFQIINRHDPTLRVTLRDKDTNDILPSSLLTLYSGETSDTATLLSNAVTDASGRASFPNLPDGTYWIRQRIPPPGYALSDEELGAFRIEKGVVYALNPETHVEEELARPVDPATGQPTVDLAMFNVLAEAMPLTILKTDPEGVPIEAYTNAEANEMSAIFAAYESDPTVDPSTMSVATATTGLISDDETTTVNEAAIGHFQSGAISNVFSPGKEYWIVETKSPKGYVKEPVARKLRLDWSTELGRYRWVDYTDPENIVLYDQEVTFQNRRVSEYPGTGGMGAVIFIATGALLMGTAIPLAQKRKK